MTAHRHNDEVRRFGRCGTCQDGAQRPTPERTQLSRQKRLTVRLDVVYEVQGSLPDPGDDDARTDFLATLLETLLETGALELTDHSDPEWPASLDPQGWRVEVEGYGDLTVGPEAFEEGS